MFISRIFASVSSFICLILSFLFKFRDFNVELRTAFAAISSCFVIFFPLKKAIRKSATQTYIKSISALLHFYHSAVLSLLLRSVLHSDILEE